MAYDIHNWRPEQERDRDNVYRHNLDEHAVVIYVIRTNDAGWEVVGLGEWVSDYSKHPDRKGWTHDLGVFKRKCESAHAVHMVGTEEIKVCNILTPDYERELQQLVDAMRYKLKKNEHKGKWEKLDLPKAIDLLKQEVDELIEATGRDSHIEIILEAADVANFAMIIANLAIKKAASDV